MRRNALGILLCLSMGMAGPAGAGTLEAVETYPHAATAGRAPEEILQNQKSLQGWLIAEMPTGVLEEPVQVPVLPGEMDEVDRRDREDPGRSVVGLSKSVGMRIDLAELNRAWTGPGRIAGPMPDGGFVWALALASRGASALRVGLGNLRLPGTAELYVHNGRGQAFGPYALDRAGPSGILWSHTVMGSTIVVQVHLRGPVEPADLRTAGFTIQSLGHLGPRFQPARVVQAEAFCPYNVSCIENAECFDHATWGGLEDAQKSVAMMLWVSGAFIYTCTGGLLADTDPATEIPYFLTANHCLSKNTAANNLETYFRYSVPCGGGCPAEWAGGGIQVLGAQVVSTNRTGDYTLLQLQEAPPAGSVFMGWTTANVADANGTELFRVSHPATAPQAFSKQIVDTSAPTCIGIPRGDWIYSRDLIGATEGGSSGAPVCNAAGQVVGQLTGACGFNTGDACDPVQNATIDGAFASYFGAISQFLAPGGCIPSPEICDGLDNDCDGGIDEDFALPTGQVSLTLTSGLLSWTEDPDATAYDVVRGDMQALAAAGDFSSATTECLADDLPAISLADPEVPPPASVSWTLVRPVSCIGNGSYGDPDRDAEIDASPSSCP